MIAIIAMTALCTGAIAFYLRFLFALLMECKYDWICYLVRLRGELKKYPLPEPQGDETARLALLEIASLPTEDSRRYYAKPGEAEWGC